jgi:hypothetical protein
VYGVGADVDGGQDGRHSPPVSQPSGADATDRSPGAVGSYPMRGAV